MIIKNKIVALTLIKKEAFYSNKEENSINDHVEFPRVYLYLKNF